MAITPTISVIIPIYNVEKWLGSCLESLLNQSMPDWEAILVDDKSTDHSGAIAKDYASRDSRFHLIQHDQNKGLGESRNTGCRAATGEFLFFLDSDDLLSRDTFRDMVACAQHTGADMVVGDFYEFMDESECIDINRLYDCRPLFRQVFDGREAGFEWTDIRDNYDVILPGIFFTTACGKFFRRARWEAQGCHVPNGLRMAEDFIPVKKFFFSGAKVVPYPHASLLYRKRPGSATTRRSEKAFEILRAYPLAMGMFESVGVLKSLQEAIDLFFIRAFRDHMLYLLPFSDWWQFYRKAAPLIGAMDYTARVGYIDGINLWRWKRGSLSGFFQILRFFSKTRISQIASRFRDA